ncbi:MAG: ABC transporter permease [Oligoflexia bacterium]|nr:ABC transporter permease [Oligoflexia bacterium]
MSSLAANRKINTEMKIGAAICSVYLVWALGWFVYQYLIAGSITEPYYPSYDITQELLPLGGKYVLGTDIYGRSIFEVLSSGLIYSLVVALTVSLSCAAIGIVMGYFSVTAHSSIAVLLDLTINLIFVFPSILIAILIMSVSGQSFTGLVFALIITGWPGYARIARGETMRVMGLSYVEASKAIGVGKVRLFIKTVLPAILPLLLIHIVLGISGVIISESSLGFLGLGGSEYSWGSMLAVAKTVLLEAPHMVVILSLAMAGLIIGLNLLGDGLRDYLDPQNKD